MDLILGVFEAVVAFCVIIIVVRVMGMLITRYNKK
jgi:hypothetical protein